ncbi:tldc domain-containing protein [Stylonychia lemnae]|uniref:Tldc domain-containing protein n=1 Tax=Stylonychia lemnae TaxID=5949 RepID=A0A078AAT3_STYLE|nr:tldc domain-containing protein [Stylonychia lemnae]|eukprot:CDW78951.1 tldc domain-containing protein [Stylonychia lemnae]
MNSVYSLDNKTFYSCKQSNNLLENKSHQLHCGDTLCEECQQQQTDQIQNEQIILKHLQCQIENDHLQKKDPSYIKCDKHVEQDVETFCQSQNKLLCSRCLQESTHFDDKDSYIPFDRKFLDESLASMIPILREEINQIQNLIDDINCFINNENYNQIDQVETNEKDKLEAETLFKLIETERPKYQGFRRLVDYHLSTLDNSIDAQQKLLPISGKTKLLYKGTRDGFQAQDFHLYCDNYGPIVSFILSEHGQVFGCYTSISWSFASGYQKDKDAFIFSLSKNSLHKQYQNKDYAVYHHLQSLQVFGNGYDLCISSECNINNASSCYLGCTYEPPKGYYVGDQQTNEYLGGSYQFKVVEIEVYSVQM